MLVVVRGIAWYTDRRGEAFALPADTVVGPEALERAAVRATTSGAVDLSAQGTPLARFALWRLPAGSLPVPRRRLPLEPEPIDRIFPLGAAELPWTPERAEAAAVDLSRSWQHLFREREAFAPWGSEADAAALRTYRRQTPPRSTFRIGADRTTLSFLFPQLAPASLVYRLDASYFRLSGRDAFVPVVDECEEIRLRAVTAERQAPEVTLRITRHGWEARRVDPRGDGVPVESGDGVAEALERMAPIWQLQPPQTAASLIIVPGRR